MAMRFPLFQWLVGCVGALLAAIPAQGAFVSEAIEQIDQEIAATVARGSLPGATFRLWHRGEKHDFTTGWRETVKTGEIMTEDTIFDVASLTKVVATTPSVMKLIEMGKLQLDAPVTTYIAEFTGEGRETIPLKWLLTHNSGLPPGIKFDKDAPWQGYEEGIRRACSEPLKYAPGTDFVYSDINFILLGEIVRRISGQSLADFVQENIFKPLGMIDSGFTPVKEKLPRIAPTTVSDGEAVRGVVHDPTSRRMGGVCGHAGLFTTRADLTRYCRMLINRGQLDGVRVLKEETVALMTSIASPEAVKAKRGLGWDIDSSFSKQRGEVFALGTTYGHTGWTGPSLWIDPASATAVIFLTNRNHPTEAGSTGELRAKLGTWSARAVGLGPIPAETLAAAAQAKVKGTVKTGIDVLAAAGFAPLQGKKVGLITNHTGRNREGVATIDLLAKAPGVQLVALFSPEHGIRGELDQAKITDGKDEATGLPIYSLYGESRKPSAEQLANVDVLVFDIQDIGCRFYTYVSTMSLAMEAVAEAKKAFFVLDRPNPIGGTQIEGPLLDKGKMSFTAAHEIPVRHGMTAGELAKMIAAERKLELALTVIPCEGWQRRDYWEATGLTWVNPSPNMRSLEAAVLYPGIGLLEFTNLSVGRGTDRPFQIVGAPFIKGQDLAAAMNALNLPGLRCLPTHFTPTASVFKGERCQGIQLFLTDPHSCPAVTVGVALANCLIRLYPQQWETKNLNKLLAHDKTLEALKAGNSAQSIEQSWQRDVRKFMIKRGPHLLYR